MLDDAPGSDSATSPTSFWLRRPTSRPIFAATPAATASAEPSSAIRVRFVCQGSVGSWSPSSAAYRRSTSGASFPSGARVPAAPPSCTARRSCSMRASAARASTTATSQPAALRPNETGTACWSRVRPTIGVERCVSASSAHRAASWSSSARISSRTRRVTSIAAVSRMSWLVAPLWTSSAASLSTASRSARTNGSTGFPGERPASAMAAGSKASARHAPIASAAACGITPAPACARASACSACSIASTHALPASAARASPGTKSRSNIQTAKKTVSSSPWRCTSNS